MTSTVGLTRVVVVEDERIVREGIRAMLGGTARLAVVADTDGASAADVVAEHRPDVALLPLRLRHESGLALCRRLLLDDHRLGVIVLASALDDSVVDAWRSGARGYLLRSTGREELLSAVGAVSAGHSVLDPELGGELAKRLAGVPSAGRDRAHGLQVPHQWSPGTERSDGCRLSGREQQVLDHLGDGLTNREVARALFISEETVRSHVKSILRKLGVSSRAQAVAVALRAGIVD